MIVGIWLRMDEGFETFIYRFACRMTFEPRDEVQQGSPNLHPSSHVNGERTRETGSSALIYTDVPRIERLAMHTPKFTVTKPRVYKFF